MVRHPGKPGMPRFCPVCTGPEILSIPDVVKGLEEPSSPHVVPPELLMQPQSEIVYDAGYKRFTLLKSHVDSTRWKAKQHHTYPKLPRLGSVLLTKVLNSKWKNKYGKSHSEKWSAFTYLDALTRSLFILSVQPVWKRPLCLFHSCTNGPQSQRREWDVTPKMQKSENSRERFTCAAIMFLLSS